ncbi:MAG: FeoC-like transcriptional regulator [Pseudomonadota bacterium]|nr:FeoC-like transcriptional regulator [Pseudomonadota bacterium]
MLKAVQAYVQQHPSVTVAELALAMQTTPEMVSTLVAWLVERGYLTQPPAHCQAGCPQGCSSQGCA